VFGFAKSQVMKTKPLITVILLLGFYAVHSQDKEEYSLLLVDKDTKNIVISFSKDTTTVSLGIYRPGFETEEARKQKLLEYNKNKLLFRRLTAFPTLIPSQV
jgi:hypothetical protein